jgi:hypothetical protein
MDPLGAPLDCGGWNWYKVCYSPNRVLRRTEEARIYHWFKTTGAFPPRREAESDG